MISFIKKKEKKKKQNNKEKKKIIVLKSRSRIDLYSGMLIQDDKEKPEVGSVI